MMKSNYAGLWLLLMLAMVLIVSVAFSDDIVVGDWTVKKAPVAETLFPSPQQDITDHWLGVSDVPDSIFNVTPEIVTDSMPKSILLFGDSMTFNLAIRMARYAAQNGHKFHAVNWDSSNTKIWADCDTLANLIKRYDVDFVFVSLGSNEVYFKNPSVRMPYVRKILNVIGDIPYVWIGPPNWSKDTGINDMLAAACSKGSFFRSEGISLKRKADKIHPTRDASALWADTIMRWMPNSAHPILADVPSDSLGKVHTNVIFLKALNK